MKVGDLVTHLHEKGVGLILKTPAWINGADYLIHFSNREKPDWYRKDYLTLITSKPLDI